MLIGDNGSAATTDNLYIYYFINNNKCVELSQCYIAIKKTKQTSNDQ